MAEPSAMWIARPTWNPPRMWLAAASEAIRRLQMAGTRTKTPAEEARVFVYGRWVVEPEVGAQVR